MDTLKRNSYLLEYCDNSIYERRKTQYQIIFFFLTVVGSIVGIYLFPEKDHPLLSPDILLVPIILFFPLHQLHLYQRFQIKQLSDTKRNIWEKNDINFNWINA